MAKLKIGGNSSVQFHFIDGCPVVLMSRYNPGKVALKLRGATRYPQTMPGYKQLASLLSGSFSYFWDSGELALMGEPSDNDSLISLYGKLEEVARAYPALELEVSMIKDTGHIRHFCLFDYADGVESRLFTMEQHLHLRRWTHQKDIRAQMEALGDTPAGPMSDEQRDLVERVREIILAKTNIPADRLDAILSTEAAVISISYLMRDSKARIDDISHVRAFDTIELLALDKWGSMAVVTLLDSNNSCQDIFYQA